MADTSQTFYQCDACKIFFATIECFRNHACSCSKDQSVKQPQLEVERRTGIFCEVCFGVFYSVEDLQQHETECHHNDTPKSSASSSNDSAWTDQAHDDGSTDISGSTTGKSGSSGTEIVQAGLENTTLLKEKIEELEDRQTCAICLERNINMVFECGHLCCKECGEQLEKCHMCRCNIVKKIRLFY